MAKGERNFQAPPGLLKWLLALLLGSSTVATLVTKTWDYLARLPKSAQLEIVDVGTHFRGDDMRPHFILQNIGDKTGLITGITINGVYFEEFHTDRPLDRPRLPRTGQKGEIIYEPQTAAAVPANDFISLIPLDPVQPGSEMCVEYATGGVRQTVCTKWKGPTTAVRK